MIDKIVIVGFGRVGQANALALSAMGYSVYYHDVREPCRHYEKTYAATYIAFMHLHMWAMKIVTARIISSA